MDEEQTGGASVTPEETKLVLEWLGRAEQVLNDLSQWHTCCGGGDAAGVVGGAIAVEQAIASADWYRPATSGVDPFGLQRRICTWLAEAGHGDAADALADLDVGTLLAA